MKKLLIAMLFMAPIILAEPVLLEMQQTNPIIVDQNDSLSKPIAVLGFNLDTTCLIQFSVNGGGWRYKNWLELDGEKLYPITESHHDVSTGFTYTVLIPQGFHNVTLIYSCTDRSGSFFHSAYLQVLIFLPDKPTGLMESPDKGKTRSPMALLTSGPFVSVPGAESVSDIAGRLIPNLLHDDKVFISQLPKGIYFIKSASTTTKVVKL